MHLLAMLLLKINIALYIFLIQSILYQSTDSRPNFILLFAKSNCSQALLIEISRRFLHIGDFNEQEQSPYIATL